MRAACWHTSADAIGELRDWRDRYPDALPTRAFRNEHDDEALAARVTTTGTIWRAAIGHLVVAVPALLQRSAENSEIASADAAAVG